MEEDYNSSDLDFSAAEDDGRRIGRRAIASIVQQSTADRVQSKKTVKTLKDVGNAPSTTTARRYWLELFRHFAQETLRLDARAK